jgi:CSLREA domain-containing protein
MKSIPRHLAVLALAIALPALFAAGAGAATIQVTSTMDGSIDDIGCDLRDAVQAANTNTAVGGCNGDSAGADTILLEGGKTYKIERHAVDDTNAKGDFDIAGPVTIRATGAGLATVDANNVFGAGGNPNADRVFEVLSEAGSVVLERLKITGGFYEVPPEGIFIGGGGIYSQSDLTLRETEVVANKVIGVPYLAGGGVFTEHSLGRLTIEGSTIADNKLESINSGKSQEAVGAGIAAINGAKGLTIVNSTIAGNSIIRGTGAEGTLTGGGIYAAAKRTGAPASLQSVTIVRNTAENVGGAEFNSVTMAGTIIAGNTTTLPTSLECQNGSATASLGGNLIGSAEGGTGCNFGNPGDRYGTKAAPIAPNIGTLIGNGGLTRTAVPNTGSLAIDLGGPCPATDQRGLFRFAAAPCDAGAVEVGASATPPGRPPPPGSTPAPPPTLPLAARLAVSGKPKLTGPPQGRLILSSGLLATCPAGGPACSGRLAAAPPLLPKRGSGKPRTYGSEPISLAPGTSKTVTLKLTALASALAREAGQLRVRLTASLSAAGVTPAAATRTAIVKPPGARR